MQQIVDFPGLGLHFSFNSVAFHIGNLAVYWYGILIAVGFLLAVVYVAYRCKKFGLDLDRLIDVIIFGLIGGVVFARLFYVIFSWDQYKNNLLDIFKTWEGGMAIYGGLIGAVLIGAIACKVRKVKFLPTLDVVSLGFLIGQGIGRWGNFINVEAFGGNTTLPWGMTSPTIESYLTQHMDTLTAQGMAVDPTGMVHPCFLYESLWCILGFVLLHFYVKHRRFDGEVFLFYSMWYGAGRFVIEGLRTDSLMLGRLRVSQLLAAVFVLAALAVWIYVRYRLKKNGVPKGENLYANSSESKFILAHGYKEYKALLKKAGPEAAAIGVIFSEDGEDALEPETAKKTPAAEEAAAPDENKEETSEKEEDTEEDNKDGE
ncbi:prolipoprotein diacylglyceryl transferase [Zongyangia hominis]|uniref:Phosphatidylglycerol--prolipoprotein diacylglyceryl transferase n=1 Tax=Zongyangia hominis TaxID=2763677 RepID=A0A926E8T8_9FIRM|nr:prolipoprotein diacylglyceryl transferase [Zongyangia hominis]MBC8569437.1 prolipoprotein diacylglyceryl transferase [Zongyangia hominis]